MHSAILRPFLLLLTCMISSIGVDAAGQTKTTLSGTLTLNSDGPFALPGGDVGLGRVAFAIGIAPLFARVWRALDQTR